MPETTVKISQSYLLATPIPTYASIKPMTYRQQGDPDDYAIFLYNGVFSFVNSLPIERKFCRYICHLCRSSVNWMEVFGAKLSLQNAYRFGGKLFFALEHQSKKKSKSVNK